MADRLDEAAADLRPVGAVRVRVVVEVADARPRRAERQFLVVLVDGVLVDVERQRAVVDRRPPVHHPQDAIALLHPSARRADAVEEPHRLEVVGDVDGVRLAPGAGERQRARVPAEERQRRLHGERVHALGEVGEVGRRFRRVAEVVAREVQPRVALGVDGVVADDLARAVVVVDVGFDFLQGAVEVDVAQVAPVADLRQLRDERDDLAVGAPRRLAVVLEVARQVERRAGAVRRENPDVVVGELVRQLGGDPLAVGAPRVQAALRRVRPAADDRAVGVREGEDAARVLPGEARAVGRDGQRHAVPVGRDDRRLAEVGVLPPGLGRVLRLGLDDGDAVAAVREEVERAAVGREDALALVRARLAVHERRLADDRVHHEEVAARRERDLRAVVAERDVAVGVVVPARVVAAALRRAALDVARAGTEDDALGRLRRIRRVEAPEVELLAEDERAPVRRQRWLEDVVVGEERELRLHAGREVVVPDVARAALRVEVVEALAVGPPEGIAAVAGVHDHREELARRRLEQPDLARQGRMRVRPLAVGLVAAPREENRLAVGRHGRVGRHHVERNLLPEAPVRPHDDDSPARLRARVVAVAQAEEALAVGAPRARVGALGMVGELADRVVDDVELEDLHAAVAVGRERDLGAVGRHHRPRVRRARGAEPPRIAAAHRRDPDAVVPFEREALAVAAHARHRAEVDARPVLLRGVRRGKTAARRDQRKTRHQRPTPPAVRLHSHSFPLD